MQSAEVQEERRVRLVGRGCGECRGRRGRREYGGRKEHGECERAQAAHMEDTERLPCFATFAPHAAATTDAAVEKLTVWWPSPPVPTMSTHGTPGVTGIMCLRIALTIPATSCPVSPLALSSTRNAAAWHGSAPSMMASTPAQASSLVRLFCCSSVSSSCFISAGMARRAPCATERELARRARSCGGGGKCSEQPGCICSCVGRSPSLPNSY